MENQRIAVIRIKGTHNIRRSVNDTMRMLKLYNKFTCCVIKNSTQNIGMLNFIKDYITWGEIDENTFKILLEKRGRLAGNKRITDNYLKEKTNLSIQLFSKEFMDFKKELKDIPGLKLYFRLRPPTKGFGRIGTKHPFSLGGTLGYRKEIINELLARMI